MSVIKNSLIVLPTIEPIDKICDYTTQTASILAKNDNLVVYFFLQGKSMKEIITGFIKYKNVFRYFYKKRNIYFLNKIDFLPLKRFSFVRQINLIINIFVLKTITFFYRKKYQHKIVWLFPVFFPGYSHLWRFFKNFISVYDAIDYYFSFDKQRNKAIRKQENLALQADLVTTISHSLYKIYKRKRKNVWQVPQGFAQKEFEKYQNLKSPIKLPKERPIIAFVGGIGYRLDFLLLSELISRNQKWNFVFVGSLQKNDDIEKEVKKLFSFANSFYFKSQAKKYIPSIISQFDICLVPYNVKNPFNRHCYPMKVLEYFYMGKPVVSTPILELKRLQPYVKIAKGAKDFEKVIQRVIKNGWPKEYVKEQKQIALANSWQEKVEKISQVLKKEFPEKFND